MRGWSRIRTGKWQPLQRYAEKDSCCVKKRELCILHRCLSNVREEMDKNRATDSIEQLRRQFHGYGKFQKTIYNNPLVVPLPAALRLPWKYLREPYGIRTHGAACGWGI